MIFFHDIEGYWPESNVLWAYSSITITWHFLSRTRL